MLFDREANRFEQAAFRSAEFCSTYVNALGPTKQWRSRFNSALGESSNFARGIRTTQREAVAQLIKSAFNAAVRSLFGFNPILIRASISGLARRVVRDMEGVKR